MKLLRALWILGTLAVAVGSLLPASSPEIRAISALPVSDKVIHFSGYMVVAFLAVCAEGRARAWKLCAGLVAMGIALEFLQELVPGRSSEVLDAVADLGGVLLGLLLAIAASRGGAKQRSGPETVAAAKK
jgi:VanZ family protein